MDEPVYEAQPGIGRTPATLALLAANVAAYMAFGAMGHGFLAADPKALIDWGSNFGPYTSGGQWWRLACALSSPEDDSTGVAEFAGLMKQGDAITARIMARTKSEKPN